MVINALEKLRATNINTNENKTKTFKLGPKSSKIF